MTPWELGGRLKVDRTVNMYCVYNSVPIVNFDRLRPTLLQLPLMSQHWELQTLRRKRDDKEGLLQHLGRSRDWQILKGLSPEILETFDQQ